jgi:DNA-binding response OmpR family regulator
LVVDDDPSLRMLCRVNLELDGYRVLEAGSVEDAQSALERERVDAMLLDFHLGDRDGRELLLALGDDRPPVALFTGSYKIEPELRALADDVLPKPFSLDALAATVRGLVLSRIGIDSAR